MRRHRHLTTLATGLVAATLLVACAPGQSVEEADEPSGPQTIDMSSFEGQELDYLYFTDGPDEAATRAAIAGFEEETGATVNLQIVPFADVERTLQGRINSGTPPEVARVAAWYPYADALIDLKTYFGDDYPDQFIEGFASAAQDSDGRMLAVPSDLTMNGPFVNLDAFERAGVAVPTADEPWTWEQLVQDATAVQQANGMESAIAIDKSGHRLSTVLSQYGTALIDGEGQEGLDTAQGEAALAELDGLVQSGAILKDFWLESGSRYAGANEQFLSQQAPVYISGNWQVGQFAQTATFGWAAVPNPCEERCGGFPGGKYMVAFSDSENPALAAAFVEWMNRTENQSAIDSAAYWLPTRNDLVETGITYPDRTEDMQVFLADVAETPAETYAANGSPAFGGSATLLVEQVSLLFAGEQDTAATVEAVQSGVADLVEETSP